MAVYASGTIAGAFARWSSRTDLCRCRRPGKEAFVAAFKGELDVLKAKLVVNVDINACDDALRTMLYSACRGCTDAAGSPDVVEYLLSERHADVHKPSTASKSLPQHAALASWKDCVLAGRADDAAADRVVRILQLLRKSGSDFGAKNGEIGGGMTALEDLGSYGAKLNQHSGTARIRDALNGVAVLVPKVPQQVEPEAQTGDGQVHSPLRRTP